MVQAGEESTRPPFTIRRVEAENKPITVSHVAVTESAFQYYLEMLKRYQDGNYHDLLVLLGPQQQSGSVRLITDARLALNPYPSTPFQDVFQTASAALREAKKENSGLQILGVGTVTGNRDDVQSFLQMGYNLYWAGGDRLYDRRPMIIDNPNHSRIYALDTNRQPVAIPPNCVFPIARR